MARRVLVTGSRDWLDIHLVRNELAKLIEPNNHLTVVHGACPTGVDAVADLWAQQNAFINERHPADWKRHKGSAGYRRNAEMVALGADLCLAFIRNGSKGATHTADLAEKAGIPVRRFLETSEGAQPPGIRVISCTPPPVEGVAADNLQSELDRLERPYERVLSDDCEPGDLG